MTFSTRASLAATAAAAAFAMPVQAGMHMQMTVAEAATVDRARTVDMDPAAPPIMTARAVTDLNMRQGPGTAYGVLDIIPAGETVEVEACDSARDWCRVTYETWVGYSYAPYLATAIDGDAVRLSGNPAMSEVPVIAVRDEIETVPVVGVFERRDPAWYEGYSPVVVESEVRAYVTANPVDTVYLGGEVVPGVILPADVNVFEVPDRDYTYSYVNGVPVLVDPVDRSVVGIVY